MHHLIQTQARTPASASGHTRKTGDKWLWRGHPSIMALGYLYKLLQIIQFTTNAQKPPLLSNGGAVYCETRHSPAAVARIHYDVGPNWGAQWRLVPVTKPGINLLTLQPFTFTHFVFWILSESFYTERISTQSNRHWKHRKHYLFGSCTLLEYLYVERTL